MERKTPAYSLIKVISRIAITLLIIVPKIGYGQNYDSLKGKILEYTANDTVKVNLLIQLGLAYEEKNYDSMGIAASEGLAIAKTLNFTRGMAMCYQQLATVYSNKGAHDSAIYFFSQAITYYKVNNNVNRISACLRNIAIIYYQQGKYEQSIDYYKQIIKLNEDAKNIKEVAISVNFIGGIYSDKGNYYEALNSYLKGLQLYERINDKPGIALSLRNLADIYSLMGDNVKAHDYINKSIALYEGSENKQGVIANYVSVGSVFGQMKDYNNSLSYFYKGLKLADSIDNDMWRNICLVNIADVYYSLGRYDTAYATYTRALVIAKKVDDKNGIAYDYKGLGSVLLKKGETSKGIAYMLKAYNLMKKIGMTAPASTAALELSGAYKSIHDYPKALVYEKIYANMKDSIYNDKNDKRVQQLQFDYELGKKEGEIDLLNKTKVIEQGKSQYQNVIIWVLVLGLCFLVVFYIIVYRSRQQERKNKREISLQKEKIQRQAEQLEELNKFKDKTFSVLSHDLRGPLDAFTTILEMLDDNTISMEEFAKLKPEVNNQLTSLNLLLSNLLQWAKSYMQGHTAANPAMARLNDIAMQNIRLIYEQAQKKHIIINNDVPNDLYAFADPAQTDIIIRNLLMNAIKFTPANGMVTIGATAAGENVELSISDTGVGMTQQRIDKLFVSTAENSTYGTDGEKGTGLGLLLCYEFIKANKGSIHVTSEPGKGSRFVIKLPAMPTVA